MRQTRFSRILSERPNIGDEHIAGSATLFVVDVSSAGAWFSLDEPSKTKAIDKSMAVFCEYGSDFYPKKK